MNQDQVKEQLLRLEEDVEDFFVIFSGKTSKKVNGLYYPNTHEIILHNKNFQNDNQLIYTAIHEFAHHVHATRSPLPVGPKPHTIEFRRIFHELLAKAEKLEIYQNIFRSNPDFIALTHRIRTRYLSAGGQLMKEFGQVLIEAQQLCDRHHARFEDYLQRTLCIETQTANSMIRMHAFDVRPEVGYENMKIVASIGDPDRRDEAQQAFAEGKSRDAVRAILRSGSSEEPDPTTQLQKERRRIERTIASLQSKLEDLDRRLELVSPARENRLTERV